MYVTQGLRRAALVNGAGIATIDGQRQHTWAEVAQRVARLAGALQKLGLSAGDRVAMLAFNSDRYLEYFFAVPWAGGIIMPLNIRLALPELVYMLQDAAPQILLVDDAFKEQVPALQEKVSSLKHVILAGDGEVPAGMLPYEAILSQADPVPDAGRGGDDVVGIFYTGGTTGLSKGVMLTHKNVVCNAMSMLLCIQKGERWRFLHTAPMFHIADCQWVTGVTIQAGTHVIIPRFMPEATFQAIEQHKITHCALVPTMVNMLTIFPSARQYDVSSLRGINYGGSPMPAAVAARAADFFPTCEFFAGYGQTETSPSVTLLDSKYHVVDGPLAGRLQSAGQPVFNVEVKIVDANDEAVPPGSVGEVTVHGPNVMAGYWNKPEETARALRGGWLHTGDAGYMDEEGFLFIVDRVKDMIITGGENVYSAEVENVIHQHPAVAMCAVIGIPSQKWGEMVHAVLSLKEGHTVTEAEIMAHCRQYIAGYKCPRSIDIRQEPFPMSGAGKILKRELRAPFWQDKTRQVN